MKVRTREVIGLLQGDETDEAIQPGERPLRWAEAFDDWIEERQAKFSLNVGKDSYLAWKEFLAFTRKAPWEVQVEDVERYIEVLEAKGLRAGTIHKRLTGLSKFYKYCQEKDIDEQCRAGFNPAAKARRPRVKMYEKANYLSLEEERALLRAIKNDTSATGKRDYGLFLMLLRTGCRAGEARRLRWGDVKVEGGKAWVRLGSSKRGDAEKGKGDGGRRVCLPEEVWKAMQDYLEASGRRGVIRAEEYVFAPGREPLVREAGGNTGDWASERSLSVDQLHYLLKLYAVWAGLKAERITCHTLRHTAAMRKVEAGEGEEAVMAMLGRVSKRNTNEYLTRLREKPTGQLKIRKRGKGKHGKVPSRGPCRAGLGNHLALWHGLTAKYLPELEWLDDQGIKLKGMEREMMRWRIVMKRILILSKETESLREMLHLIEAGGTAAVRLGKLMKLRHQYRQAARKAEWDAAVDEGINEVLREWGLK